MKTVSLKIQKLKRNPPLLLGGTFAIVILVGAILLTLPQASADGSSTSFVDALFTSGSATCVTGLIVKNTASSWSPLGKGIILALIQIGGLGTMTIISIISLMLNRRIGLQERLAIKEQLNSLTMSGLVRLIKYVTTLTLVMEGVGAIFLGLRFIPQYGLQKGIVFSVFHSISAFCNAGFDILGNSMEPYQTDWLINLTVMLLVIFGGLGFSVYVDIYKKRKYRSLTIHSKMVLSMTAFLLVAGTFLILLCEYHNPKTMEGLSVPNKFLAASFQSTIARTAGFNSINIRGMTDASSFIMIILMFIGGSPGSTAGGLKTTTFGVLLATTYTVVTNKEDVVWKKRVIGQEIVKKSFVMAFIAIIVVISVTSLITIFEKDAFDFLDIFYESVSAFGTVGVSRGITADLSTPSKLILTLTMFLGRVGPTTLAFGLGKGMKKKKIRYAEGSILVG
ncbi:MAG: TrkH family potassium uptake protein [Tissierellia bacterium]|nr:TrkH family potassium uptake protein [Tissierellia bacterium]